jgi:hypothetical protein
MQRPRRSQLRLYRKKKMSYASSLSIQQLFWPLLIASIWDKTGKGPKIPQARAALDVG